MKEGKWLIALAAVLAVFLFAAPVMAAELQWTGQGRYSQNCSRSEPGTMLWVLTGVSKVTSARIVLGGSGSGDYSGYLVPGEGTYHFETPYFDPATLTAKLIYTGSLETNKKGQVTSQFVLSHYCPYLKLDVTKTAETSYTKECKWELDKEVDYADWVLKTGDKGTSTFTLTPSVKCEDTFAVRGSITIQNTGGIPAVIAGVEDIVSPDLTAEVDCGVGFLGFPYTLKVGETLVCSYQADLPDNADRINTASVTVNKPNGGTKTFSDTEDVRFGEPTIIDGCALLYDTNVGDGYELLGTFCYSDPIEAVTYKKDYICDEDQGDNKNVAWLYNFEKNKKLAVDEEQVSVICTAGAGAEKTAETSYVRTHRWEIEKKVETENGYTHDGYPKIWLFTDGSGDETATWTINVAYNGYEDDGFMVSGTIIIENTLDDRVLTVKSIEDIIDLDCEDDQPGGVQAGVDCGEGVTFPYEISAGKTLTCTYKAALSDKSACLNTANIEVEYGTVECYYDSDQQKVVCEPTPNNYQQLSLNPTAEVAWDDPSEEHYSTVTIRDISDLFGEQQLGEVTAPEGKAFTYTKDFEWGDFNCGDYTYENTAKIVETGQSASATLKVNVVCNYEYETAYAMGDGAICFIPRFSNWGWTNPIKPGHYKWELWAAAGQCDTSKGTLAGTVTVDYTDDDSDGYYDVRVNYLMNSGFTLEETHVYAGYGMFPLDKNGQLTVAPGQYKNQGPFDGTQIYVIAHAVVGIPKIPE